MGTPSSLPFAPVSLVLRSALLSLSKDARVSKDGRKRDRAQWPSFETAARRARPPQDEVRGCIRSFDTINFTQSILLPALRRRLLFRLRLPLLADILLLLEEILGGGGFAGCHHQAFLAP